MKRMNCLRAIRGALLLTVLGAGGCATVPAWQRETLTHPAMGEELDPEGATFDAHVAGAREVALDPGSSGGGGCGCN